MGILVAVAGVVPAVLGAYLVTLAAAAFGSRKPAAPATERTRVAVLVPAHDESALISRCVQSLLSQTYPADLTRVIVIADNCTDDTAGIAEADGAYVMVRTAPDARGKGRALRWAMDRLLAEAQPPDAIAVVDADSVADPDMLQQLVAVLAAGHDVVQADYAMFDGRSETTQMAAIGFVLFHHVRFFGRERLGMAANLVGNGMLFRTEVLERLPWNAFTPAEDLDYSIRLRLAGYAPRFAPSARVWGPGPASATGATRQRMRWEGGRFYVMRTWLPRLVAAVVTQRRLSLLDAVIDLATPPLGLLAIVAWGGFTAAIVLAVFGVIPSWSVATWLFASAAVPAFVVLGLVAAGRPRAVWNVVVGAPRFLVWKVATYARLARAFDVNGWDRTDRAVQ